MVDHLQRVVKHVEEATRADEEDAEGDAAKVKAKRPPRVSIGSVIGGLSAHKQKRILDRGADVLVATPGRLWDLIKSVSHTCWGLFLPYSSEIRKREREREPRS